MGNILTQRGTLCTLLFLSFNLCPGQYLDFYGNPTVWLSFDNPTQLITLDFFGHLKNQI